MVAFSSLGKLLLIKISEEEKKMEIIDHYEYGCEESDYSDIFSPNLVYPCSEKDLLLLNYIQDGK